MDEIILIDDVARVEAMILDRIPMAEPWRSRWCRLHALHTVAMATNNYRAAAPLADARYLQFCHFQGAVIAGLVKPADLQFGEGAS